MKHILPLFFLTTIGISYGYSQSDIPGADSFQKAFGEEIALDVEKCCFAEYGWHIACEVKNDTVRIQNLQGNDVAVELLLASITPQTSEQYFTTPDGRLVVVSSFSTFEKMLSRFIVNVNATNK